MGVNEIKSVLQELCKVLESEGYDPIRQLKGFILSGDPIYLRVHTGGSRDLKSFVANMDRDELLDAILKTVLQ